MQLAAHEFHELRELAMSCVNTITNMGAFINQVQDQQLKSILEKHFPLHVQDYNMKVDYLSKANGPNQTLNVPKLNQMLTSYTQAPVQQYAPVTPRTDVVQFDDREIATSYLLTLKRAGREYAWSTMEMSHPEIRTFLENAFRMSSHHAFEVWQWMVQKGYYQLDQVQQPALTQAAQTYQPVPQQQYTF